MDKKEIALLQIISGVIFFWGVWVLFKVDWHILVGVIMLMWGNNIANKYK